MSDVPPSPDVQSTAKIDPADGQDRSELVPEPPAFPVRSDAPRRPDGPVDPGQGLWPAPTATSQVDPAQLPPASLVTPTPPVHPVDDQAVIRLEGLPARADARSATAVTDRLTGRPAGTALLNQDHGGQPAEPALEFVRANPILSVFSRDPNQAHTLYRRQTVWAGLLLLVLLAIGAVTFPRSWRDPGPGMAVETDVDGADPAAPNGEGVGPVVDADPIDGEGANRGAIAGTAARGGRQASRPAATTSSTTAETGDTGLPTPTFTSGVETSATVGPSGPGTSCPGAVPVAGCVTTTPDPVGPTTSLIEATTSTRVSVVSSATTARTTTTQRGTTTARPTTTRRTTTTRPATTIRRTTTTRPTTTRLTTTTTRPTTTTTTEPTTTTTVATTTASTATTEVQDTTTSTLTESTGRPSLPGQCQSEPPPPGCQPDP